MVAVVAAAPGHVLTGPAQGRQSCCHCLVSSERGDPLPQPPAAQPPPSLCRAASISMGTHRGQWAGASPGISARSEEGPVLPNEGQGCGGACACRGAAGRGGGYWPGNLHLSCIHPCLPLCTGLCWSHREAAQLSGLRGNERGSRTAGGRGAASKEGRDQTEPFPPSGSSVCRGVGRHHLSQPDPNDPQDPNDPHNLHDRVPASLGHTGSRLAGLAATSPPAGKAEGPLGSVSLFPSEFRLRGPGHPPARLQVMLLHGCHLGHCPPSLPHALLLGVRDSLCQPRGREWGPSAHGRCLPFAGPAAAAGPWTPGSEARVQAPRAQVGLQPRSPSSTAAPLGAWPVGLSCC